MLPTSCEQFGDGPFLFQHGCAQRKVHKDMNEGVWRRRMWLACTESWPQPDRTPLEWIRAETEPGLPAASFVPKAQGRPRQDKPYCCEVIALHHHVASNEVNFKNCNNSTLNLISKSSGFDVKTWVTQVYFCTLYNFKNKTKKCAQHTCCTVM